jgi:hypothetical protein
MKKPRTGQYRINLDTGKVYVVGSKATETPNLEKQASLLQWGEDVFKLRLWQWLAHHRGSCWDGVGRDSASLEELLHHRQGGTPAATN